LPAALFWAPQALKAALAGHRRTGMPTYDQRRLWERDHEKEVPPH
jgi:hypothetical protein